MTGESQTHLLTNQKRAPNSTSSLLWLLGLAGKWVGQASPSCLHKGKESRNQWAVFTGYTADCNSARCVTHSQAVKTDQLLAGLSPAHLALKQAETAATQQRRSAPDVMFPRVRAAKDHQSNVLTRFLCVKMRRQDTHAGSTQTGPLRNLCPRESGLSVYTSLCSFLLGKTDTVQFLREDTNETNRTS